MFEHKIQKKFYCERHKEGREEATKGIPNVDEEKLKEDTKKKVENPQSEISYREIEVSKPNFLCHIEYVLIPHEPPKFIDIVCWNEAAKIYFENSTSAIIPLKVDKLKWIHFRVNHNVKLNIEEIPTFLSHDVKFTIKLGSKNFGEPAKSDKTKKFYGPKFSNSNFQIENSIQKQMFQPLSESLEDLLTVSYFKEHLTPSQQLYISLDTTLETSENFNKLFRRMMDLSNEYHDENFERKPTPPFEEIPPMINILERTKPVTNEPAVPKRVKEKKVEKKDMKNKEVDNMEFSITGEQFFSGRKVFERCLKYNMEELPYVFCLGTVKSVLSKAQATIYNPLSVIISSLNCVPVDELKKGGITKLKFRFLICNQLLAESNLIPIEKRMKINLARTIFTHTIDKQELIYFIQTGGVNVEILGNHNESQFLKKDADNSRNNRSTDEEFVTLGRFSADISSILLQPHRVLLKCNLQTSNAYGVSCETPNYELTSINDFNSCLRKDNANVLGYFNNSNPVLTIAAGLGHPLTKTWQMVTTSPDLFNRLFVVIYDMDLAVPIIRLIQDEVDEILGLPDYTKKGKNVKRPLTKNNTGELKNDDSGRKTQMSGFLVDCVDKILIYAESSVFGAVQKVWASTSFLSPLHGRVLYDSSLVFFDRLYDNLFQFGGFIGISLNEPLHVILSKPQTYGSQSIPKPAQRALRCLSLLTDCRSIKTATKNNLFPDFHSLVSLAIEFGVPLQIS